MNTQALCPECNGAKRNATGRIVCRHCGHIVSPEAAQCMRCGQPEAASDEFLNCSLCDGLGTINASEIAEVTSIFNSNRRWGLVILTVPVTMLLITFQKIPGVSWEDFPGNSMTYVFIFGLSGLIGLVKFVLG